MSLDRAEMGQSCHLERDLGGDTRGTQTHRLLDLLVFKHGWQEGPAMERAASSSTQNQ